MDSRANDKIIWENFKLFPIFLCVCVAHSFAINLPNEYKNIWHSVGQYMHGFPLCQMIEFYELVKITIRVEVYKGQRGK